MCRCGDRYVMTGAGKVTSGPHGAARFATLISPLFVAPLLTRVSGVPLLEKRADKTWGGRADYEAYKARTPVLVRRPPRA